MSKDEMQEQVVDKKKNKIVLFAGILGVLLLVVLGVVITPHIISANKDRKVNEQLEEAQHFLDDLDYEQAIVAYEAAIEIDPMSVEAYLGLAEVYEQQGNYERALEVLQLGYEKTQSDNILQEINRIESLISQKDNEQTIETQIEGDSQYPIAVPGRVVEGIYHNPYYEYPLNAEDKDYLVQIIDQVEQGNYETALDLMDNDRLIAIVERFADGESYINAMVNDKKVHIFTTVYNNEMQLYNSVEIVSLPLNSGYGYYLHNSINRDNNGFENGYFCDQDIVCYGYSECKEGVFWGDYNWKMTIIDTSGNNEQDLRTSTSITEGNVPLVNGLFDGQCTEYHYWTDYDNTTTSTLVQTYDMGLVKYWNLQEGNDAEFEYCTFSWGYNANGEETSITNSGSLEYVKEWLDSCRYTMMMLSNYEEYYQIDGGWRYYYW